jgi:hypothetical protein
MMTFVIPRAGTQSECAGHDHEDEQFAFHNLFLPNLLLTMVMSQ